MNKRHLGWQFADALARALIGVCVVCALIIAHEPRGLPLDHPRVVTLR